MRLRRFGGSAVVHAQLKSGLSESHSIYFHQSGESKYCWQIGLASRQSTSFCTQRRSCRFRRSHQ